MEILIIPFAIAAGSFVFLRKIFLNVEEKPSTRVQLFVVGIVSWVFILSAGIWLLLPIYLLYLLFAVGNLGAVLALAFFAIISGLAFQLNETIDSATVFHYLRDSALFLPIRPQYMHIQEELDKKRIRDVHQETSDKPFPDAGKQKRLLTQEEIRQYKQEMTAARERPTRSRQHDEEIASLKSGMITNLSDGWKVYTFDHKLHDFYTEMSQLQIDPGVRALQFKLNIPNATEQALQDSMYVYQLKQELYHLFSVLHTDRWLTGYSAYFDRIATVCYGIEPDSFGHSQLYPFMKIDIACSELRQREGKIFNAADLHTISALTFNDGKPLPEELL